MLQNYLVTDDEIKAFNHKLKKNTTVIKTLFVLLTYLEEHLKKEEQSQPSQRRQSYMQGPTNYPYITQLHNLYSLLTATEPPAEISPKFSDEGIEYFYDSMLHDVKKWLNEVANTIKKEVKG
jgi:hypothetical protein